MAIITYNSHRAEPNLNPGESIIRRQIEHWGSCPHNNAVESRTEIEGSALTPECGDKCCLGFWIESYKGRVISLTERNGYDDSDFYAQVITDLDTLATDSICYATTRGWTYYNGAAIDASPDLRARYDARVQSDRVQAGIERARRETEASEKLPMIGRKVRVTSSRSKVEIGTEGEVCWFGKSSFARPAGRYLSDNAAAMLPLLYTASEMVANNLRDYRVGIRLIDGTRVFCSATCVEVIQEEVSAKADQVHEPK